MTIGDLFKLDLKGTIGGKLAVNTFFYRAATGDVSSSDVAIEFDATVLPEIKTIETVRKLYDTVECQNLFDPEDDYAMSATTAAGVTIGEDGGGHSAIPFILKSKTRAIRDGAKRFGPLSEDYNEDGVLTGGGFLTELDDVALALETDLDLGSGHIAEPVIVKRILYEVGDPPHDAYRLPENLGESDYSEIAAAIPRLRATTQNSRKSWVGA